MKKIYCLSILFLCCLLANGQEIKKDSLNCICVYSVPVKYPDVGQKDELSGSVIVEYEIDSACVSSNPKIVQSLGPDYDKEVLKAVNSMLLALNRGNMKCKFHDCKKGKIQVPFNFVSPNSSTK